MLRLSLRRLLMASLACAALAAAAATPALAAPTWLEPVSLTGEPDDAGQSQVALDANGDAFAIWERNGLIEASVRPAGGAWGSAVTVSVAGPHPDRAEDRGRCCRRSDRDLAERHPDERNDRELDAPRGRGMATSDPALGRR